MTTEAQPHRSPGGGSPTPPAGADGTERAAAVLTAAGFPRMPARVLMTITAGPQDGLTAAEIGQRLGVSPAAVSGATTYLEKTGILHRVARQGSRKARFLIAPGGWGDMVRANLSVYERLADAFDLIGDESAEPGDAASVHETAEFFRFLKRRLPLLLDEWDAARG